jgi:hypothetical protein
VEVNDLITLDDYKNVLSKWKETTSTSPSGRHLGHYISLLKLIGDKTDKMSDRILHLHHMMLQLAQQCCKPFEQWKTETEEMLEKDKGDPKINWLCIICLPLQG